MDKINFASATGAKKNQWSSKTSFIFILSIITAIIFLQVRQWTVLKKLSKEKKSQNHLVTKLNNVLEKKNKLQEKQKELQKRLNKVKRVQNNPPLYFSLFSWRK